MGIRQIIAGTLLILAIGAFVVSRLQFRETGYLFHNAYFWASREKRGQMDKNKERKRLYYRQSGFAFLLIGSIFLVFAVCIITDWVWMYFVLWVLVIAAVVYAVVSSIRVERHESDKIP